MIIYVDILSNDEIVSDSYPSKPLEHKGEAIPGVFTVQSKMVVKGPVTVNTGANASAEGGDDDVDDQAVKVCNLKDAEVGFGYEGPQSYSAEEFGTLYKGWCKAVKEAIEAKGGKPKDFMQCAKAFLPYLKEKYSDMEVYHPKSFNPATFILAIWDDEANEVGAPKFIFFEPALKKEKV